MVRGRGPLASPVHAATALQAKLFHKGRGLALGLEGATMALGVDEGTRQVASVKGRRVVE